MSVEHYENFPVASWLCPPSLRAPISAIYWFARTADDIADEGEFPVTERRAQLDAYRQELKRVATGAMPLPPWARIFVPLQQAIRDHDLPVHLLDDLVCAFLRDTANPIYDTQDDLLDYCRQSANPIGRLLLHLHRLDSPTQLAQSDDICSALQLINFWQDLSVDLPRGRCYLPADMARRHGLVASEVRAVEPGAAQRAMLADLCTWAAGLMHRGAPLVHALPGRAGWELRLVVQGGLRVLEKIRGMNHATFTHRPVLVATDAPRMLWRSLTMPVRAPQELAR